MMWFPDLFERFGAFGKMHPGESAGVCQVTSVVTLALEGEVNLHNHNHACFSLFLYFVVLTLSFDQI